MPRATTSRYRAYDRQNPICPVFERFNQIGAAYTGRGAVSQNSHFSFARPPAEGSTENSKHFGPNLQQLASSLGFKPGALLLPNGAWPHSGHAIKDEDYTWIPNSASGTLMPVTGTNQPVTYDAIASRSKRYVLGVQGADCPAIFLYDPCSQVIGLAHAGWKPLVRNVVGKVVDAMVDLGAQRQNVLAYISPGAGDRYNAFKWDEDMEESVKDVFIKAGRTDLLKDPAIRHLMTSVDRDRLQSALGGELFNVSAFKISLLAITELLRCGIPEANISRSNDSTIVDRYSSQSLEESTTFKYHSFRRERPNHGLSISVLFFKSSG